jgi:small-conductance mechanosensitive channel
MSFWGATPAAAPAPGELNVSPIQMERRPSAGDSSRTSRATSKAGRCDPATYAEAMQAVSDLEQVGATPGTGYGRRALNRVDAFLLAGLEEGDGGDEFLSGRSDSDKKPLALDPSPSPRQGPLAQEPSHFRKLIPAADTTDSLPSFPQPNSRLSASRNDAKLPSDGTPGPRNWMPFCNALLARLAWFLTVELLVGLVMLAPTIAVIIVNVPRPYVEPASSASGPPMPPAPPELGARVDTGGIFLLILRPMYALLSARLISLLVAGFFGLPYIQRLLPGIVLLVLHHAFRMHWAIPAALYPAAIAIFFAVQLDHDAWALLFGIQDFVAIALWLMAAGLCSVFLDAGVALWQSQLTVQHYENRSHSAYDYHKCLKRIAGAARTAQRREEKAQERRRKDDAAAALLQAQIRALALRRAAAARRHATSSDMTTSSQHSSPARGMAALMKQGARSSKSRQSRMSSNHSVSTRLDEAPSAHVDDAKNLEETLKSMPGSAPAPEPAEVAPPQPPAAPAPFPGPAVRPPPPLLPTKSSNQLPAKSPNKATRATSKGSEGRTAGWAGGRKATKDPPAPGQPEQQQQQQQQPPPAKIVPPRAGGLKAQTLEKRLNALAGPFDFGSDISSASTIAQARRRAARLFSVVLEQPELRVPVAEGSAPAVDRDKLMAWAYAEVNKVPPRNIAAEVFSFAPAVDEEQFIKVVERSYTEQRLLTASVAAFDRLHSNVRSFLQCVLLFVFLVILLALWSISIVNWLLPLGSAILSVAVLAGGITSDVLDSFFFAYIIRPYDIGDRVTIAAPGEAPVLFSMVVKDVFLMRSHFYACNGDSLMISNSSLRRMGITNLTRSGPMTMLVEVMVPASTLAAKMNELSDAIINYCTSSNEWAHAELQYASTHFDAGHMMLRIWCESCYAAHDVGPMYGAKSRLLLFCHAYMQSAGIEYLQPILPVRPDRALTGSAQQSLAALFDRPP